MSDQHHGLVGRTSRDGGNDHHPWASRDYMADISCECVLCPINDRSGHCKIPTAVVIGADGACKTYLDYKSRKKERVVFKLEERGEQPQTQARCRYCGGPIRLRSVSPPLHAIDVGNKWEHVSGEKFQHPATP